MNKRFFIFALLFHFSVLAIAREGMWIPMLLNRNIDEMQQMGFQLSADDLYSVNHASLKDAIVLFERGCTGEVISPDGLLITNHHCGFSAIQKHSSLEHDYLTDGFWAMDKSQELPNKDLTVTFLVEMRNVTDKVLAGTDSLITENTIAEKIRENSVILVDEATDGTLYNATVKSFFSENQYFLIITEKFTDVRLVGAPPSSIGNFGGDTDNWMWPRHTGDFSMFRIYADSLNQPANYSPNNVPYHPKKYLSINIKGFSKDDFTMVYGYPAKTQENLYSEAVEQIISQRDPDRIAIRTAKLNVLTEAMEKNPEVRIKYAAKKRSTSNAWKKWKGEIKGLQRLNAVQVKKDREKEFTAWVNANKNRQYQYGNVLPSYSKLYDQLAPYQKAKDYFDEVINRGTDVFALYRHLQNNIINNESWDKDEELAYLKKHFKDYDQEVDDQVFMVLMKKYNNDLDKNRWEPEKFAKLMNKNNALKKLNKIYSTSLLANEKELSNLLSTADYKQLTNKLSHDKLVQFFDEFTRLYYRNILPRYNRLSETLEQVQKEYVGALLEMDNEKLMYPDANQTLRVSYGKIEGYDPADGIAYDYYTTIDGVIAKDNPKIYDYDVPIRLKTLYREKDFGNYTNAKGELPVCFTASNHTTGGNSGSPVLDKNGYLIGINFDRCWEGTMSDIMFDPEKCRNISLDMRYMLFLIDKFAGAGYLLNEMKIIR